MYQHPHLYRTNQALQKNANHPYVFPTLMSTLSLMQGTRKTKETHGLFHDFPGKAAFPEPALDPEGSWDRGNYHMGETPRGTKRWKHVFFFLRNAGWVTVSRDFIGISPHLKHIQCSV